MAEYESVLFHLELIRKKTISLQETEILTFFSCENADEAAYYVDFCCPPLTEREEASNYLWTVWEMIVNIIISPDVTTEIHEHFVRILQSLSQVAKGDLAVWTGAQRVWKDLPLLPQCMEAYYNNPMRETEVFTPESVQIWRNWSSFAARCMGAGVLGPYIQVIDALQQALEEELGADQDIARTECKIQVACEWITHGAKPLLWWARENIGLFDVAEDSTQYFPGGPLYYGPPAVCLRRWGFWQTRFEKLGKYPGLKEEIQKAALEAANTMTTIERRIANTL